MILRAGSVPDTAVEGSAPRREARFGDAAGLRLIGVNMVTLAPGQHSALRHWHSGSDEFVLILEGTATVIDEDDAHELQPGDLALWAAGRPNAHHIVNRSDGDLRYLCAGTNPATETVHYPDDDRRLIWDAPEARLVDGAGRLIRAWTE